MECKRCGAALPSNSYVCRRCGALMTSEQIEFQKNFNKENNLSFAQNLKSQNYNKGNNIIYNKHETDYKGLIIIGFIFLFLILMSIIIFIIRK